MRKSGGEKYAGAEGGERGVVGGAGSEGVGGGRNVRQGSKGVEIHARQVCQGTKICVGSRNCAVLEECVGRNARVEIFK